MVMTYYNPLEHSGCRFHGFETLGNAALEGKDALGRQVIPELQNLEEGLNDRIRSIAAAHQAAVAELVPGGKFPDRLEFFALTDDCQHPNEAGHAIIADAFKAAFPPTTMISGLR
jgi:hypothetical protein